MKEVTMKLNCRSLAKFDAVVARIRQELSYPIEGLLDPPPRWEAEAFLAGPEKQLVVLAGLDDEVLRNFPYQQVALPEFVVAGQDADFPLKETESEVFAKSVHTANEAFERQYRGVEWRPQVARLIIELKLASPVLDIHAARNDLLSPLRDHLDATSILPPLPDAMDFDAVDPVHREIELERSLFLAAELQLSHILPEEEAVDRIRKCMPQCPATLIGKRVWLAGAGPSQHRVSFRVRQF